MAKINIEFDTVSKKLEVSMDGKEVENVVAIDICQCYNCGDADGDEYRCCLTSRVKDEDEDHITLTQVIAAQNENFRVTSESKVSRDIQKFFSDEK